jgi:hypothetical protein
MCVAMRLVNKNKQAVMFYTLRWETKKLNELKYLSTDKQRKESEK